MKKRPEKICCPCTLICPVYMLWLLGINQKTHFSVIFRQQRVWLITAIWLTISWRRRICIWWCTSIRFQSFIWRCSSIWFQLPSRGPRCHSIWRVRCTIFLHVLVLSLSIHCIPTKEFNVKFASTNECCSFFFLHESWK